MDVYKASEQDQKQAEQIRRQYINREDNKIEQLQSLDHKVKLPGRIIASIFGTVGALIMGAGMSLIMVWENMSLGLTVSVSGMIIVLVAYPIYVLVTNSRKKKYQEEILRLSEEVIKT